MPPKMPTGAGAAAATSDEAQAQAAKLLQNPMFVKMFEQAMKKSAGGGGGEDIDPKDALPANDDPNREKWLKDMQERLQKEMEEEAKKDLEKVQVDDDGTAWMYIEPQPGFCIKCRVKSGERAGTKVFINICKHKVIQEPMPMEDWEVPDQSMADTIRYRVPLSLGPCRVDTDKKGEPCHVYDVAVNTNTVMRCGEDREFRRFVCAMAMFHIHEKAEPHMDADEFTNLNFKCKGKPAIQRVHARQAPGTGPRGSGAMGGDIQLPSNPSGPTAPTVQASSKKTGKMVMEVDPADLEKKAGAAAQHAAAASSSTVEEEKEKKPSFECKKVGAYDWSPHQKPTKNPYFHEPVPAEFCVEVQLGERTTSAKEVDVRVGPKNKSLELRWIDDVEDDEDCSPFMTVPFPCPVDETPASAKFSKKTRVLTLRMATRLPDEVAMEQRSAEEQRAEREAEEAAEKAKQSAEDRALAERRAKFERIDREEKEVMAKRREIVENMQAVQAGDIPPMLRKEIEDMPKEQAQQMLVRLEGRVRNSDGIDQLLDKLPDEAIFSTCNALRDKLGLELKKPPEKPAPPVRTEDEEQGETKEYNFAKKAENIFGVQFYNRYLFALDN